MQGDDVGVLEERLLASRRRMALGPGLVERRGAAPDDHVHPERLAVAGHHGADLAVAPDAERLAAQADADRMGLPLAGPERHHLLRNPTERGDDEPPRQLGRRIRRPPGAGQRAHQHAAPRGGVDVDVREDTDLADQTQAIETLEQRRPDRRALADQAERLGVGQALGQRLDVLGVIVPDRHRVAGHPGKAGERPDRVLPVVEDRDVHARSLSRGRAVYSEPHVGATRPTEHARSLPSQPAQAIGLAGVSEDALEVPSEHSIIFRIH